MSFRIFVTGIVTLFILSCGQSADVNTNPPLNTPEGGGPIRTKIPNLGGAFRVGSVDKKFQRTDIQSCIFDSSRKESVVVLENQTAGTGFSIRLTNLDTTINQYRFSGTSFDNRVHFKTGSDPKKEAFLSGKVVDQAIETNCSGQFKVEDGYLELNGSCENVFSPAGESQGASFQVICTVQESNDWVVE